MDKEKLLNQIGKCIEKAANDFQNEKVVDHQALQALLDSVRILHHVEQMKKQEPTP